MCVQLVVLWLEHDCRYQYTEDLLQHVRYGLMDVPALHHLAHSHPLVQSSPIAAALVDEALDYHHATFAQPLHQSAITGPRFQSLTLYIIGGRKREVSRVRELRYFNPSAQEHVRVAGGSNWSELAAMPTGRSHHCVAVMGNFLFVVGGEAEHATGRTCAVRTACRYDPRGNRWIEIAPMKACREHFVLGALGQYLYAVGGRNELRQVLPSVERYCPKRNKWMFVQPFDRSLSCHAGCVADDLLWVSGTQRWRETHTSVKTSCCMFIYSISYRKSSCCASVTGGVTNTAQYQNRLMVYDPEQVTIQGFNQLYSSKVQQL